MGLISAWKRRFGRLTARLAWDPELERFVALKYLRHEDPELVERLFREARAQARIDHPGVCKVYEAGTGEDGRPFIAMQYVEGRQLDVAAEGLGLEQKVVLVRQVAEAVHAAHAAGLVHRDLKPGNILVGEDGDGRLRPYVLDFGIAREQEVPGLTLTGQILGTPGYLSPEQARGDVAGIDRRTDVFSLGVILYELLSGKRPFAGDSNASLLVSLLSDEPAPLRRHAPSVPRDLETVVATCLEKDPDRRYPSARALAEDLGRFLDGDPVAARRRSWLARLAVRARRHPRLSLAAAAATLAIAVLLGLVVHQRWSAAQRIELASRFGQEVERVELITRHAHLLPLHDIRPELARARARLSWIQSEMRRLGGGALALGHEALGRGHLVLGEVETARRHLEQAWRLGERTPRLSAALGLSLARLYRRELDEAAEIRNPELREERIAVARRELGEPARAFLEGSRVGVDRPQYLAAWLAFASDDLAAALDYLEELRRSDPYFSPGRLLEGAVHRRQYQQAVEAGDAEGADSAFAAALDAYTAATVVGRSDPEPHAELCALWVQAARIQYYSSDGGLAAARDAALHACGRALEANADSVAAHLESGRAHRFWASREADAGRDPGAGLEAARRHAGRASELDPANDDALILLGVCHRIAANVLAEKGNDPRPELLAAVDAYERAIRLRPGDYGAVTSLAVAHLYLGVEARARGESPVAHFERAADTARQAADGHPGLVGAWVNLGIAEGQLGVWQRDTGGAAAASFARGAAALRRAIEVNPRFFTAHYNLGEMLVEEAEGEVLQGRDPAPILDEAAPMLEVSRDQFPDWAPPGYVLAYAAALRAEYARRSGIDPQPWLAEARAAAGAAAAIRGDDANGLLMASFVELVAARWRVDRGQDPSPAARAGLELVERALAANPNLARAWLRRAELELADAAWTGRGSRSPVPALDRAAAALVRAVELNPGDAAVHAATAELWRRRAELRIAAGGDPSSEIATGLEAAARALVIDAARPAAHAERARLERLAGRVAETDAAGAEARRLDPLLTPSVGVDRDQAPVGKASSVSRAISPAR